jgi:hypothetical protein
MQRLLRPLWILWILDSLFAPASVLPYCILYVCTCARSYPLYCYITLPERSNRGEFPSCGTRVLGDPPAESFATCTQYQRVGCPVYSFLITRNELPHPSIGLQSRLFHWAILLVVLSKGILAGMWRYVGSGCVGSSRNNPGRKGWSNPGSPGDGSWL